MGHLRGDAGSGAQWNDYSPLPEPLAYPEGASVPTTSPAESSVPGRGLLRYYGYIAVVFMNVLVLIVGLNVLAWVILEAGQWWKKESKTPYKFRGYDQSLQAVYPGFTKE